MEFFAVHLKLLDTSDCNFRYDIINEVPHLTSPPPGGPTIVPQHLLLRFTPDADGRWELDMVSVFGMPVVNGVIKQRKRLSNVLFLHPLEDDTQEMPDWLAEIARHHQNLMNPEDLYDRQYEAARAVSREMFGGLMPGETGNAVADEVTNKILNAARRVG